jgi:alpha-1,2-mannosyltransferase
VLAFVVFVAVNVHASYDHLGLLDTQVYRMGGQAVLDRADLYDVRYPWDHLPFTYPPFAAIAFVPLAWLGFAGGALAMTVASLAALARSLQLVVRRVLPSDASRTATATVVVVGVCAAVALWSVRSTLEYGQVNLVVMWLVLEDLLGPVARKRWSGVLLGLAIGLKLTPAIFVVLLLATRQGRKAAVALGTFAATVLLGFAVQPASAWTYWTGTAFDSSRVGPPDDVNNQSIAGLIDRLVGRPATLGWLVVAVVVLVAVTVLARRLWLLGRPAASVAVMAVGGLLCSPISWAHHWVWLLPAVVVVAGEALGEPALDRRGRNGLLATAIAMVVAGSIRIETIVSDGAIGWRSPTLFDPLPGNLYLLVALGFLATQVAVLRLAARQPAAATATARTR